MDAEERSPFVQGLFLYSSPPPPPLLLRLCYSDTCWTFAALHLQVQRSDIPLLALWAVRAARCGVHFAFSSAGLLLTLSRAGRSCICSPPVNRWASVSAARADTPCAYFLRLCRAYAWR